MDILKTLQELLDPYEDLEAEAYKVQKEALKKGFKVKLYVPKEEVVKFGNQIMKPHQQVKYVLNEVLLIKDVLQIRGYLSKIKIFKNDTLEISLEKSDGKTTKIFQLEPGKYSFENFFQALAVQDGLEETDILHIKLIKEGEARLAAEKESGVFDTSYFLNYLKIGLVQQLELLQVLSQGNPKKKTVLKERMKLWGFNEEAFSKSFTQCLCPSDFGVKEIFRLHQIHDKFLQEISNEQLQNYNVLTLSYLEKLNYLIESLNKGQVLWVKK